MDSQFNQVIGDFMEKNYSVFIGDVALDEYYRTPRWPGIADKVEVETMEAIPGGMIANAACVYASMGNKVKFCTTLKHSATTSFLLEDLEKAGIDTSMTIYNENLADSKTMIFLTEDEHTIFIPILHVDRIEINEEQLEILKGAKYIYSTCGNLNLISMGDRKWPELAETIRENGTRIVIDYDVDYERNGDDNRFRNVDIGFFNETGFNNVRADRTPEEEIRHLKELGMQIIVVTLAEKGCVIYEGENIYEIPGRKVEVADVTGAGDTFCSSFISALEEKGIYEAGRFANAAASICVSKMGARAGAVGKEEVEKLL